MVMTSAAVPPAPILMVSTPVPVPIFMARANDPPAPIFKVVAAAVPKEMVVAVISPSFSSPEALVSRPWAAATVMLPVVATSKLAKLMREPVPAPLMMTSSKAEPRFMVSFKELLVARFKMLPPVPVPRLMAV